MSAIVDTRWFRGRGTIGVVLTKGDHIGYRAYIGVAMEINEEYDAEFIINQGTKLNRNIAAAYYPKLIKEGILYDGKKTVTRRKKRANAQVKE